MNNHIANNYFRVVLFASLFLVFGASLHLYSELWVEVPNKVNANEIIEVHYISSHVAPPDGEWGKAVLEIDGDVVGESGNPSDTFNIVFDAPGSTELIVHTFSADGKELDSLGRMVSVLGVGLVQPKTNELIPVGSHVFLQADAVFADKIVDFVDFEEAPFGKDSFQKIFGSRDSSYPYAYLWEPSHTGLTDIRAVVHHSDGSVSFSVPVCVQICHHSARQSLDVTILDPSPGISVSAGILRQVNVDVSVNEEEQIRSVSFYVDGVLIDSSSDVDMEFPYQFDWTPSHPGSHSLVAIAEDAHGMRVASNEVVVTASDDRPHCELLLPVEGSVFQSGKAVSLVAIASGQGGSRDRVDRVEFLVNGNQIPLNSGSFADRNPPFSGNWVPAFPGSYFISARVFDKVTGASYQTPSVKVHVEENQLPLVRVVAPYSEDQFYVGETVKFRAIGSDRDGLLSGISFYLNDVLIGEGVFSDGAFTLLYEFQSSGVFRIRAVAIDDGNRQSLSDTVDVIVNNRKGIRPSVEILWPKNNQEFTTGDTTQFAAQASDEDGNVSSVQFYMNRELVGGELTAFPFNLNAVVFPSAGVYLIEAVAKDNDGNRSLRDEVKVVAKDPTVVRPSIEVINPQSYTTFQVGDRILIEADAKDYDGIITAVSFSVNGDTVGELDESFPFQSDLYELKAPGLYRIEAIAFDQQGNMSPAADSVVYAIPEEPSETVAFNPLENNRDFLIQLYVDLFMRGPTDQELNSFLEYLEFGMLSKADIVQNLHASDEYRSLQDLHDIFEGTVGEWPAPVEFASILQGREVLQEPAPSRNVDDVKDSFSGAQAILSFSADQYGLIEQLGDVDMFVFQIDSESLVTIESNGPGDTTGTLYNSDQESIAYDDDSGLFFNFGIQRLLSPGTYYLAVSGWLGASASYNLSFSIGDKRILPVDSRNSMIDVEESVNSILGSTRFLFGNGFSSEIPESDSERRLLFTQVYKNRFGENPSPQQILQGSSRMQSSASLASFLLSFVRNEKIGFNDFIYNLPNLERRDDAAFFVKSFFKEKAMVETVELLEPLSLEEQIQSVLRDERYLSRFQFVQNKPEHPTIVPLSVIAENIDEYQFQTVVKDFDNDFHQPNSHVNPFVAIKEVDGWKYLEWFGWFSDLEYPWVYHEHLGWIKVDGFVPDEFWIWSEKFEWAYAAKESYPYLFRYIDEKWLKVVTGKEAGEFDLE